VFADKAHYRTKSVLDRATVLPHMAGEHTLKVKVFSYTCLWRNHADES
jgi:hypothetical protein